MFLKVLLSLFTKYINNKTFLAIMWDVAIIANGSLNNKAFHKKALKSYKTIICADGGANNADSLGIIPGIISAISA